MGSSKPDPLHQVPSTDTGENRSCLVEVISSWRKKGREEEGSGGDLVAFRLSAGSFWTEQLSNPLGGAASQPGGVPPEPQRRGCSSVGSDIGRAGSDFHLDAEPLSCLHLPTSKYHTGASCLQTSMCCSVDWSSLTMEGSSLSTEADNKWPVKLCIS